MPSRMHLSDEAEREERADEELLRRLENQHRGLLDRRHQLITEVRRISGEQKALYDRRQTPQAEVEAMYQEHAQMGKRLAELRHLRDKARQQVESKVIARRELFLTLGPAEPARPEAIRREIAELELRQQTRALTLADENALIARLRERSKELKSAEAHAAQIQEHQRQRKAAETSIVEARGAVEQIATEMDRTRVARDQKMVDIRAKLEAAGGLVAEMRAKGRARAELMAQVDGVSREITALEQQGKEVFQRLKARRAEARQLLRTFAPPRERAPRDVVATAADRRFEELMKRGKVSLGG